MAARLNALEIPHTFLKAIDGRTLSAAELERASPRRKLAFGRPLMPAEIACGLSHLAAIAEGARLDCDFFCVLEDDIIPAAKLPLCLARDALAALAEFDVLRLFTHLDRWEKPSRIVDDFHGSVVVRMLRPGWGCQGQIYSRQGPKNSGGPDLRARADRLCTVPRLSRRRTQGDRIEAGYGRTRSCPGQLDRPSGVGEGTEDTDRAARPRADPCAAKISGLRRAFFVPGAYVNFYRSCRCGVDERQIARVTEDQNARPQSTTDRSLLLTPGRKTSSACPARCA